mmetsp:Transcript_20473/g.61034  ORF Transcript_20473/g.61034 Transcript_20473/m.61034 type:complete len:369 (-) Transcript_20473:525-1631(-)
MREALLGLVRVLRALLRPHEDQRHAEHRGDGEDLVRAPVRRRADQHLGELRVQGELGGLIADLCHLAVVVEALQVVEHLESAHERLRRGRVQEVEVDQVVDPQLLQGQHHDAEVGPEDLGVGLLRQLRLERLLRVEPETLARLRAAGTPRALRRRGLRHRRNQQGLHSNPGVVDLLLRESGVDDVDDAVDGDGRLRDVRGDDDFAAVRAAGVLRARRDLEDLLLLCRRKRRVERYRRELAALGVAGGFLPQGAARVLDLLLAREEEQDVPFGLRVVDLDHGPDGSLEVVPLGLGSVEDLHRVCPARDVQQRRLVEVGLHLRRVHRRGHDHHLQVGPPLHDLLEKAEEHVRRQRPLVGLVEDHDAVLGH